MQATAEQGGNALARPVGLGGAPSRRRRPPFVFWAPALLVSLAMALPLVYLVERSLDGGAEVVDLLLRPRTLQIMLRSMLLVAVVTAASALIAVPLAWLTVRTDLPLRRFWSVVTVLPLVIPSYVGAFLVVVALGPRGMLQGFLEPLGVERLPDISGLAGAALTITLLSYPYTLLSVRAALWGQDPALEEMSRALGNDRWRTMWRVTLPLLRPSIAAGSLLVALYTLSDFGAVSLLRYETFTWAIYLQYETAFNRALAAALSLVMIAFALGLGSPRGASARPVPVLPGGHWRGAPGGAGGAGQAEVARRSASLPSVTALSLAAPLSLLGFWAVRGIAAGEPVRLLWGNALNSVYGSGLAAIVAVAAAVPVVLFTLRFPGRLSWVVERLAYTGFALPGIAVALALIFFGARFATPLYQTLALLVFAYVVLFFPQALGAVRAGYLQVSPRLGEAAYGLGKSPLGIIWHVSLPLMLPGMLAGGALVFLTAMKELPATLLLSPIGFGTLATSIWSAAEEAFFAQAAVPALLLVAVSAAPTAFLILREPRRGR